MRPADYVQPILPAPRIGRQWRRISAELARRPPKNWAIKARVAFGVVTLAAAGVVVSRFATTTTDTFVVASLPEGRQELVFTDGSRVTVAPGGRLRVDRVSKGDVAMHLETGHAHFDVHHDPARRFAVMVNEIEVVDRGTRFDVERGDEKRPGVDVTVEEGEVELRGAARAESLRLSAGESWTNRRPEVVTRTDVPSSGLLEGSASSGNAVDKGTSGAKIDPSEEPSGSRTNINGSGAASRIESRGARDLFEAGSRAKLDGRLSDAADAFDALRRRYRSDARASLAAVELGRLRLNHLGDPEGALAALEDAVKLGPRAALREEAELRIIDALWALGRAADCARARDEFMARHPRSAHTSSMTGRCAAH